MVIYVLVQYIFHHLQNCFIDFACILKVISFSITLLLLYLHDIQRCAEDFLLDESALETESPVGPSDISGWAWLGSGQWVV